MPDLKPGTTHKLPPGQLTVTLSSEAASHLRLVVLQDGDRAVGVHWYGDDVVLSSSSAGTFKISVESSFDGLIAPHTKAGLILTLSSSAPVAIAQVDVASRRSAVLAVVAVDATGMAVQVPAPPPPAHPDEDEGAQAFRTAFADRNPSDPTSWVLIVDGSLSMMERLAKEPAQRDLAVVCGALADWQQRSAAKILITGVEGPSSVTPETDESQSAAVVRSVVGATAPPTWLHLEPAMRSAVEALPAAGVVIAVLDSVPGDLDAVADLLSQSQCPRLLLVLRGSAADLSDFGSLEGLVSFTCEFDGSLNTQRAVEMALSVASPKGAAQ